MEVAVVCMTLLTHPPSTNIPALGRFDDNTTAQIMEVGGVD